MLYTVKVRVRIPNGEKVRETWATLHAGKTRDEARQIERDLYEDADKHHRRRPHVRLVPERNHVTATVTEEVS